MFLPDGVRDQLRGYGLRDRLVNCALAVVALLAFGIAPVMAAPKILALGDSLTAGYGVRPSESLPVRLEVRLKADGIAAQIVNAGVSGDTTAGGLARLDWALQEKPQFALVELGANDALRGLDPKAAYKNLDGILARLKSAGVKTLLIGMKAPANWGQDYQKEFDAIYPALADKYRVPLYPFILDGVALDPKLTQPDGLHPNPAGVDEMVRRMAPAVEALVKEGGAS
jgi:acyl-CoA thioesterase I